MLSAIQDPLFLHVRLIVGDDHDAEDAMQEILLAISGKLGSLRDVQWFRAWAYRIATREAVRYSRRRSRAPVTLDSEEMDNLPIESLEPEIDAELMANLSSAVSTLPPASQIVVRMHYMEGLTQPEVAEALELSVGTVKSRLAYGLGLLRTRLDVTR